MSTLKRLLKSAVMIAALGLSSAYAHSPLLNSVPADAETLAVSPAAITLTFKNDVTLVQLTLTGESVDEKLRPRVNSKSAEHSVVLPMLKAGVYKAAWRAIGNDGHLMKGTITFTLKP